jgi:hypothetical protein
MKMLKEKTETPECLPVAEVIKVTTIEKNRISKCERGFRRSSILSRDGTFIIQS